MTTRPGEDVDRRFRDTFENAAVGIAHVSVDGRWLRANRRACEVTGYSQDELLGTTFIEITHPDDLEADRSQSRRLMAGELTTYSMEQRYLRKDGSAVPVQLTVSLVRTDRGDPDYLIAVVEDITARKRAEADLRFQKFALDESSIVAITDVRGDITYVNEKFCEISGYSQEELVGKNHRIINSGYHPREFFHEMYLTISQGKVWRGEIRNRSKQGAYYWVDTTIVPSMGAGGKPDRYLAIRTDITERKITESQLTFYKDALDSTAIVAVTDPAGTIEFVNDKFVEISGYAREELIGKNHRLLNSGLHARTFWTDMYRAASKGSVWRAEIRNKRKDGSFYWVDTTIVPMLGATGKPERYVAIRSDITDRKLAESQLTFYKDALDSTAIVAVTDPAGTIEFVNDKFVEISGYAREELIGKNHRLLNSGLHPKPFWTEMYRMAVKGQVWRAEIRNKRKDGSFYWVDTTIVPMMGATGKPERFVAIRSDITERKLTESQLTFYKDALDSTAIVAVTDPAGTIEFVNDKFVEISGYAREELIGKNHRLLNSGLHPKTFWTDMYRAVSHGQVWRAEIRNRRKDKTYYWVDTTIVPMMGATGKPERFVAIRTDITNRKLAESALTFYKDALDSTAIVAVTDPAGTIEFVNDKFVEISGYSRPELIGQNHRLLNSSLHPKTFWTDMYRAVAHGQVWRAEIRNKRKDGSYYWVDTTIVPMLGAGGKPERYVAIRSDITDRKSAQDALSLHAQSLSEAVRKATEELSQAHERQRMTERLAAMGTLAAGLGHDMGNLLLPIRLRLEALEGMRLPEPAINEVEAIRTSATYLQKLSNGLRMLSIDPAKSISTTEMTEVSSWWAESQPLLRNALPRGVSILGEIAVEDCWVPVSRPALMQAVFNLVQNAGDAMKTQTALGTVTVSARIEGEYVLLSVADTGPGMTDEVKRRCMEPFFTTKTRRISTGLGLAFVSGIIQEAGGKMEVESEPGKGTTFTLRLPRTKAPAPGTPGGVRSAVVRLRDPRTKAYVLAELRRANFNIAPDGELPMVDLAVVDRPEELTAARVLRLDPRNSLVAVRQSLLDAVGRTKEPTIGARP